LAEHVVSIKSIKYQSLSEFIRQAIINELTKNGYMVNYKPPKRGGYREKRSKQNE